MLIGDSQAVKNTDTADKETKGFCFYKFTNGIKRHLCVDVLGFPIMIHCTPANISDDQGLLEMIKKNLNYFKTKPVSTKKITILLDSGYHKDHLETELKKSYPQILTKIRIQIAPKITREQKEKAGKTGFVVVAKRWIIERSNSWMEKCRTLWKNCEGKISTSEAKIRLCFIRLLLRRLTR